MYVCISLIWPDWPVDNIFVLLGVIISLCLDTVSAPTSVGHLLCCRPNCLEITERWSAWSDA